VSNLRLHFVILGLSITSSWGNGHATNYRGLVKALSEDNHEVIFLERDVPWYADNRDLPHPPYGCTVLYQSLEELKGQFSSEVRNADLVLVGSYVPQGIEVGQWVTETAQGVTAFYDIDTPATLLKLELGNCDYLSPELVSRYDLNLSFAGGPMLEKLAQNYGAPMPRAFYCCVDPSLHHPEERPLEWDLGYMGTYSEDRQPTLDRLLLGPARAWPDGKFLVAGPMYPEALEWPVSINRISHLPPSEHRGFYNSQRFTLNITRADMVKAGWSPSVRLFEAAACGTPVITDYWEGLGSFFELGDEILVARSTRECLDCLQRIPEEERIAIGQRARARVLTQHTAAHRAAEMVKYTRKLLSQRKHD
jgi:spore maturation protein CgeB